MMDRFSYLVEQQALAFKVLFKANLPFGCLTILYSTIDIFAYIWAGGDDRHAGLRFRDFVDKYLIKRLPEITSPDLWGARCAILHTASPDSTASKTGRARRLLYCWGAGEIENIREVIKHGPNPSSHIGLRFEYLEHALSAGLQEFAEDLQKDSSLLSSCDSRLKQIYSIIDLGKMNEMGNFYNNVSQDL